MAQSPQPSPGIERGNPFDKKDKNEESEKDDKPTPIAHTGPRRQSVLVPAGKETKIDHPGFLSSALRRLSSTNTSSLGRGGNQGAICPRRVLNVDQNRARVKIAEFDQSKLKRVAFCVDVEIAGFASQADDDSTQNSVPPISNAGQKQGITAPATKSKDANKAKYKDKGEGAAFKNPEIATEQKARLGQTSVDAENDIEEARELKTEAEDPAPDTQADSGPVPALPTTRKKEKKKRSEAERKERREKKRKHAEANGLVPLEYTRADDDSDSSPSSTPPGATTPKRAGDQPTTDPLRIYKRCCQLRETTALECVQEQISKPAATLAEAPGTVAVVDLSNNPMSLQDITTLGDWLAVVPVRKLVLDDCELTDEAIRIILSGLASCKSVEQRRQNRRLPKRGSGRRGEEQLGVIEKLSLKNNSDITNLGWKHIALFLHLSKSIKGIDLSGIPFPQSSGNLSRSSTASNTTSSTFASSANNMNLGPLVVRAISERLGNKLEELILSGCGLTTADVGDIVDCAIKCKIRRLGLANNNLNQEALMHIVRYVQSGTCEGLDLGSNDLHGIGHIIAEAVDENNPLFAVSLSNCNLTPDDLGAIFKPFVKLRNLKFIDLSRNYNLFGGNFSAVPIFRKFLPRLESLKRIHLADTALSPDYVIALSEILPDCPAMAHVNILENEQLVHAMNSKSGGAQEEACAFLAALMTAVRVSRTIVAIEVEVPSSDSSEVIRAIASQVVAYSLRNMERSALNEVNVNPANMPGKDAPEVLLDIVGHMEGYAENHDNDEPAPDDDYVIASTGIVKALGVCLSEKDGGSRAQSRNISPTASGAVTPRQGLHQSDAHKKPRDVSLELCESARKIRMRLRPALVREDRAGNDAEYRRCHQPNFIALANNSTGRLFFLDQTLQNMIQRFEDEYPETKIPSLPSSTPPQTSTSLSSSMADTSQLSASLESNGLYKVPSPEDDAFEPDPSDERYAIKLNRTPSNTSLASRAFTEEEGRMHRFGQSMRREVLKPTGTDDYEHGTSIDDTPEPAYIAALRARLETFRGEEIRQKVEQEGVDNVIRRLGINAQELMML